jgi:hypothetical protein
MNFKMEQIWLPTYEGVEIPIGLPCSATITMNQAYCFQGEIIAVRSGETNNSSVYIMSRSVLLRMPDDECRMAYSVLRSCLGEMAITNIQKED